MKTKHLAAQLHLPGTPTPPLPERIELRVTFCLEGDDARRWHTFKNSMPPNLALSQSQVTRALVISGLLASTHEN